MNTKNKLISLQREKNENSINLLDILKYLLFHWKWFLLSVLVFGGYYLYQYSKTPFVYSQSQTVMIKTPMNTQTTARLTRTNSAFNSVSVAGEILQLHSKELMRQTISRVGADVSYSVRKGLRDYELYKKSPFSIKLDANSIDSSFAMSVIPVDSKSVLVKDWDKGGEGKSIKVALNRETNTPFGKILVTPSAYYDESSYGQEVSVKRSPMEQLVGYFLSNLDIKQMQEDASLLQITMQDRSSERAGDLITMLITVYNEISIRDKNKIGVNTAEFIEERLAVIEGELGLVESQIDRLRSANQGVDIGTAGSTYFSESRQHQSERTKIETDRNLVQMMRGYLNRNGKQNELIPNITGLVDGTVEEQIASYNSTLLKRNRLVESGSSANPVVQELDKSLGAMRRNIDRAVDNSLAGLDIKIRNIQQEEQIARGKAMQVPRQQRVMLSLERQQKVKEELYVYLLNKTEENALNQAMTDDNVRIVDPASGSKAPIYPSRTKKLMMGVGLGLAIPAVALLLILMLNTKVRSRKEIEEALSVPFLGEIPLTKYSYKDESTILVSKTGRDALTETFRILRTNISFMAKDGNAPQVITFTSFSTGAGKTFTALNLAATYSFTNKKVVVLDLDLRKGTMSLPIQVGQGKGVSHYLADPSVTLSDIIHKRSENKQLDFIPIGVVAPNPVELLMSTRLDQLIEELKKEYDYIIVDGVPVGIVADASIADRISDLTMFIIRSGKMDRRILPDIESIYEESKLTNLAVVLNGVKLGGSGYGYGTYGYGGYGYGYGYGGEKKNFFQRWLRK